MEDQIDYMEKIKDRQEMATDYLVDQQDKTYGPFPPTAWRVAKKMKSVTDAMKIAVEVIAGVVPIAMLMGFDIPLWVLFMAIIIVGIIAGIRVVLGND